MKENTDFTSGKIVLPLIKFALPTLFALFLQSMYGAVDLMITGHFAGPADISAVSTGSQIMMTITNIVCSMAMGITILLAEKTGQKKPQEGGAIVGTGIMLFAITGVVMTLVCIFLAPQMARTMNAPEEAFSKTVSYISICGAGSLVIVAYNLIGSIFRGIGDSKTPLVTVAIACVFNILGDLLLIRVFGLGAKGAALATVFAQLISVLISFLLIRRKDLPFTFSRASLRWNGSYAKRILLLGVPIALQDMLVGISFLIILSIVNSLGLIYSAAIGVAEKVCAFIMLIPVAFMHSMSAFTAQNRGAGKIDRAVKGFWSAVGISSVSGFIMFLLAFFKGSTLASVFSTDAQVTSEAAMYLKAYGIDCLLTCFLFCFIGFFNGMGKTRFVMIQGVTAAFLVRVPVSYFMSKEVPVSLFHIGLAIPLSTVLGIALCMIYYAFTMRSLKKEDQLKQADTTSSIIR
ncbi:MAG: MATE family efflux transporter [Sphaerochaetaceae bacterium]|nr:MATE family efflux transporter [Sphaerochaetaceae bacterium]